MADCSCIRGNFNCYVEAIDTTTLVYQDLSDWMDEAGYVYPSDYSIQVTFPARKTAKEVFVNTGAITRIANENGSVLKDGIYCFQVSSCGNVYTRSKALFPNIECCLKQAWATLGKEWQEKLEEVGNYLKYAAIHAELNNITLASQTLKIAEKLLGNIKCDCDC